MIGNEEQTNQSLPSRTKTNCEDNKTSATPLNLEIDYGYDEIMEQPDCKPLTKEEIEEMNRKLEKMYCPLCGGSGKTLCRNHQAMENQSRR